MVSRRPLRIGLLGASRIAPRAVIGPAAKRIDVEIVSIGARNRDRARAYAVEHGIAHTADSYMDVVTSDDIDLVYLALPPAKHREWAEAALARGKAVLCEKPFAQNADEARAMVVAASEAARPLLEAFHYRFHAVFRRVERIVATGRLGTLREATADFCLPLGDQRDDFRWQAKLGGGALADLGCYAIHALRTVTASEPVVDSARMVRTEGVDATTEATCLFGAIRAQIACSMVASKPQAMLRLVGDRATLTLENYVAPQLGHRLTIAEGRQVIWRGEIAGAASYDGQLEHVLDVVVHGANPIIGGQDSILTMTALDAIRAAAG